MRVNTLGQTISVKKSFTVFSRLIICIIKLCFELKFKIKDVFVVKSYHVLYQLHYLE